MDSDECQQVLYFLTINLRDAIKRNSILKISKHRNEANIKKLNQKNKEIFFKKIKMCYNLINIDTTYISNVCILFIPYH